MEKNYLSNWLITAPHKVQNIDTLGFLLNHRIN